MESHMIHSLQEGDFLVHPLCLPLVEQSSLTDHSQQCNGLIPSLCNGPYPLQVQTTHCDDCEQGPPAQHCARIRNEGRHRNLVPRHKRIPHRRAEIKRRFNIKRGFGELEELIPKSHQHKTKASKAAKLLEAVEYCRRLQEEHKHGDNVAKALREEIEAITKEIEERQTILPAVGVSVVKKPPCEMDTLLEDYIRSRTRENWKFQIFSILVRQLFASFNTMLSTAATEEFVHTVILWVERHCSLTSLRPVIMTLLRHFSSRQSDLVISDRYALPQDNFHELFGYSSNG